MKLVVISDTHLLRQEAINIPEGDVLIHCGDFLNQGGFKEMLRFLEWWKRLPHKRKLIVAGNHDRCLDEADEYFNPAAEQLLKECKDTTYLRDSGVKIDTAQFWGSPWVASPPRGWGFLRDDKFRKAAFGAIPENVDVLITHTPPYGVLDGPCQTSIGMLRGAGCPELRKELDRIQPAMHFFGHVHERAGDILIARTGVRMEKSVCTIFHNAANLNRKYLPYRPASVFELL